MSREWKPGDVAMVELVSGGERPSVMIGHDPAERCWHSAEDNGDLRCLHADAVAVRPLVVIDPEDREAVERLASEFLTHATAQRATVEAVANTMQAALREFANPTPPKPEEPTGLGAVVEDDDGFAWVRWTSSHRSGRCWKHAEESGNYRKYAEIPAVRVLSEGVQP